MPARRHAHHHRVGLFDDRDRAAARAVPVGRRSAFHTEGHLVRVRVRAGAGARARARARARDRVGLALALSPRP